jgi:hypothetical protein
MVSMDVFYSDFTDYLFIGSSVGDCRYSWRQQIANLIRLVSHLAKRTHSLVSHPESQDDGPSTMCDT